MPDLHQGANESLAEKGGGMSFKIISVGWQCSQFLERTLASVESQSVSDWEIMVVYDHSIDDGALKVQNWCSTRDDRWHYQLNQEQRWAVQNQYEGVRALDPADDDIIVYLDLDGDQLAHPEVFAHLLDYYSDDTLVTYGNYQPIPFAATCPPATPYPPEVVANRSYRWHILNNGTGPCFNHLRTIKGRVWKAIPEDRFKRPNGEWYESGTDYVVMVPALELADGRYKCIEEVLLLYNNENPLADYITHPAGTSGNIKDALERPALPRLENWIS